MAGPDRDAARSTVESSANSYFAQAVFHFPLWLLYGPAGAGSGQPSTFVAAIVFLPPLHVPSLSERVHPPLRRTETNSGMALAIDADAA